MIHCKEGYFDIEGGVVPPYFRISEFPDEALHAPLQEEAVDFSLQIISFFLWDFTEECSHISNMILDLFGGKIIQTAEVLEGEFGTGKEVKLVTEALLGQVVAHIAEVILGYCIEGPLFLFHLLHGRDISPPVHEPCAVIPHANVHMPKFPLLRMETHENYPNAAMNSGIIGERAVGVNRGIPSSF